MSSKKTMYYNYAKMFSISKAVILKKKKTITKKKVNFCFKSNYIELIHCCCTVP